MLLLLPDVIPGPKNDAKRWLWLTLALSSVTVVALVFAGWELIENRFFRYADYVTLHFLYITRGIASSLILGFWAAWFVLRQRRKSEEDLRRSHERYRGLMEAFPGAVILFDSDLTIVEWNVTAEKIYGYTKSEIRGMPLPTVPPGRAGELRDLMKRASAGETILDLETMRLTSSGQPFEVQLSLLPFHEAGAPYFLEVTADIRERVRWRKTMLEVEKLTSMGKMAAGTAHHLNSPIAALLLRVQMMRERNDNAGMAADIDRLEDGLKFCRQFVQRLLEYTRGDPARKQVQPLDSTLESVAAFFQPAMAARDVKFSSELSVAEGLSIFADRSLVEVLLLTLLTNALDAVPAGGEIRLSCRTVSSGEIEIAVTDTGCGISEANLAKVFEPFFTTKEPGKGTGLGLAIVKNLVTEHGGSIRLVSKPGEGTAALVQLPLCPALPLVDGGGIEAKQ